MKSLPTLAAMTVLGLPWAGAQNVLPEPPEDLVQKAIREFQQRDSGKANEVTVVLDPAKEAEPKPEGPSQSPAVTESEAKSDSEAPVLVTGKAPEDFAQAEESQSADPPADQEMPPAVAEGPKKGLSVHVEKLQTGTGHIDPSKVKLLAPFPAKPLSVAPAGWKIEIADHVPPFTREVELSPGKKITLKVKPHLLVPDADGATVFNVRESGFDPALSYQQHDTVGAILANSVRELETESKALGGAIDKLQQLLVSLPKPELEPPTPVVPQPKRKR